MKAVIEGKNLEIYNKLIENKEPLTTKEKTHLKKYGHPVLVNAVTEYNEDLAVELLNTYDVPATPINPNYTGYYCAIYMALIRHYWNVAKILLDKGVNVTEPPAHYSSVVDSMLGQGETPVLKWLNEQGIDILSSYSKKAYEIGTSNTYYAKYIESFFDLLHAKANDQAYASGQTNDQAYASGQTNDQAYASGQTNGQDYAGGQTNGQDYAGGQAGSTYIVQTTGDNNHASGEFDPDHSYFTTS